MNACRKSLFGFIPFALTESGCFALVMGLSALVLGFPSAATEPARGASGQSGPQLVAFQRSFSVLPREAEAFALVVTEPGPITIDVRYEGQPIKVTLQGPLGQPQVNGGRGRIQI